MYRISGVQNIVIETPRKPPGPLSHYTNERERSQFVKAKRQYDYAFSAKAQILAEINDLDQTDTRGVRRSARVSTCVMRYVCTYVRMCVSAYVRTYVGTYVRTYVRTYVFQYLGTYLSLIHI